MDYERWRVERLFVLVPAQAYVAKFLETFNEFPPRQKPGSFSIDQVMENMQAAAKGGAN
jgi:arylsulfatase